MRDQVTGFQCAVGHQVEHVGDGGLAIKPVAVVSREHVAGGMRDGDQGNALVVKEFHRKRVEVQRWFATPRQCDDGHSSPRTDDLQSRTVRGPGIGRQDHQIDTFAPGKFSELTVEVGVVVEQPGVSTDAGGHVESDGAVADGDGSCSEEWSQGHGAQAQNAQSHNRDVLTRLEGGLAVAQG